MQLRLCITAHTSAAGHCKGLSTEQAQSPAFIWSVLPDDVRLLVSHCIHCLSTKVEKMILRSYCPASRRTESNDLLQFDYIELGPGSIVDKYILMLRDDHSRYSRFYRSNTNSSETAAHAITE